MPVELKQSSIELQSISSINNDELSKPLNGMVPLLLAWPTGDDSFKSRDAADNSFFVLALGNKDGRHLEIFEAKHLFDTGVLRDLPVGEYEMVIVVHNNTKPIDPIKIHLHWPGDINHVDIKPISHC